MKYFLATYFNIKGLPPEELVHFIIRAKNIDKAKEFTDCDTYFLDTIRKAFPLIDDDCVNAMICALPSCMRVMNKFKTDVDMEAFVLNGKHQHLSTYLNLKESK